MIFGSLTPWLALGTVLALIGAFLGGNYHGHSAERSQWQAVQATERAAAATLQAKAEKAASEANSRADEAARTIEETHAKDMATADATRADFDERLRRATSRPSRCDGLPAAAPNPGVGAVPATGGQPGPGNAAFDAGERLRGAIVTLQAYAKACHAYAMEAGR